MTNNKNSNDDRQKKPGRFMLWLSFLSFLCFAANILIGKISILAGGFTAKGIGDVGEFLILFVSVVCFIAACLARERASIEINKT